MKSSYPMKIIKILIVASSLIGLALTLSACPGSPMANNWKRDAEQREFKAHPPSHLTIRYEATHGKVGHHMVAWPSALCGPKWKHNTSNKISGSLPPGLILRGFNIEGTPKSPGYWEATLRFTGLKCRGKSYPDQNVRVYFNIGGIAPRRVR